MKKQFIAILLVALVLVTGCTQPAVETPTLGPTQTAPTETLKPTPTPIPTPTPSASPAPVPTTPTTPYGPAMGDPFEGKSVDTSKWDVRILNHGQAAQDGRLALSTSGEFSDSTVQVFTRSQWVGDFDVQIDYSAGSGWTGSAVALAGMGIFVDNKNWISMQRGTKQGTNYVNIRSTFPGKQDLPYLSVGGMTAKFRIIRNGSSITFKCYRGSVWMDIYTVSNAGMPVWLYIYVQSGQTAGAFTTYFDNFRINSGITTYKP